jgi:hypothetical protein
MLTRTFNCTLSIGVHQWFQFFVVSVLCSLASFCRGACLARADASGEQIVLRYLGESARRDAILSMAVDYSEPGRERLHLEFTWMRKIRQGLASHLLRIETPESEKGKLLLVRERPGGGADYLAYRPGSVLKKRVRITGAREYKFKGLSISVQELIGGELLMYTHEFKGNETLDGISCQLVESTLPSRFRNDSGYPRTRIFFRKDTGMPLRWELFGRSGQLEKIIFIEEVRKIDGIWTIARARVEDLKKKGRLALTLKEVHYHPDLKDTLFSEEYLKQASR